mmetsp:Transcript_47017/g.144950  ORF Transcript_47017/g.144950 Transcript_47017/m.144950 type:complete len:225 (-) Transcript_47017:430-1104(-)
MSPHASRAASFSIPWKPSVKLDSVASSQLVAAASTVFWSCAMPSTSAQKSPKTRASDEKTPWPSQSTKPTKNMMNTVSIGMQLRQLHTAAAPPRMTDPIGSEKMMNMTKPKSSTYERNVSECSLSASSISFFAFSASCFVLVPLNRSSWNVVSVFSLYLVTVSSRLMRLMWSSIICGAASRSSTRPSRLCTVWSDARLPQMPTPTPRRMSSSAYALGRTMSIVP